MRIRSIGRSTDDGVQLQMTPMIDIVFQLLVFFIMTFKIIAPEGDFSIKMPQAAAQGVPQPDAPPPIKVRLRADERGELRSVQFGDVSLGTGAGAFQALNAKIRGMVGDEPGPGVLESTEVELDCDYNLKYEYLIEAMTAVSGRIEGDRIIKLIEKIKLTPPHGS